jgi:hypothetical protein
MKNSDWRRIKEVLHRRMLNILGNLLDREWSLQLNRECNNLLSAEMAGIAKELGIPDIPDNHEYRAELKINPVTKVVKIQLRHQLKRPQTGKRCGDA